MHLTPDLANLLSERVIISARSNPRHLGTSGGFKSTSLAEDLCSNPLIIQ
jgi:hypothetical protein